jgi:hypothetical protein
MCEVLKKLKFMLGIVTIAIAQLFGGSAFAYKQCDIHQYESHTVISTEQIEKLALEPLHW